MTDQDQAQSLPALFAEAARTLEGHQPGSGSAADLLARLGYTEPTANRVALLRAAAGFDRIFMLRADDAPGLVVFGAQLHGGGVSGTGLTFQEAFESCAGEGAEFHAQFVTAHDRIEVLPDQAALASAEPALIDLWDRLRPIRRGAGPAAWTVAADMATGRPVLVPADLCYRRPADQRDLDAPLALSIGCGAGPDKLAATLHGLLELIERDAVSLWWRGGLRGRMLPVGAGGGTLERLRGLRTGRQTWLLDITSDIGVPTVAALSCNPDGRGLCLGHAARPTQDAAVRAALQEVAQMELAHRIAAAKAEAALTDLDRRHIRRYETVDVGLTQALHPLAPPGRSADLPEREPVALLAALRARIGQPVCVLDLTRAGIGIAVTRAICPWLEIGIEAPPGPRLRAAAAKTGADPMACPPL